MAGPHVEAVIVNHNTSLFAELALRSLVAGHQHGKADLRVTIRDNHSSDPDFESLEAAANDCGVPIEESRWPASATPLNSHGDVFATSCVTARTATTTCSLTATSTSKNQTRSTG